MTDNATVINTEDITEDFDRVRVTPCDPTSSTRYTHVARAYVEVEPNMFGQPTDVSLNEYDAVRAMVCRSVNVPSHRISWERESVSPDPV